MQTQTITREQIINLVRLAPEDKLTSLYDFARFVVLWHPMPTLDDLLQDMDKETPQATEQAWAQAAADDARAEWDTPQEDAAWAHLQEVK